METLEFEKLVNEALGNLPQFFKKNLDNVEIVVEEWPTLAVTRGRLLLGLYQGVPKTVYGRNYRPSIGDKITIFKGPIEWIARGDIQTIKNLVVDTVEHEIAHHFGISDKRLLELNR